MEINAKKKQAVYYNGQMQGQPAWVGVVGPEQVTL